MFPRPHNTILCVLISSVFSMYDMCIKLVYSDKDINDTLYSDIKTFLAQRYPTNPFDENVVVDKSINISPWTMQSYHNFYQKYHKEWDNSTAVLLEIAGGPCIYPHISAAPYVAEIYHTDYVKACCDEVLLWKSKNPNAYDWSLYFKQVVEKLEGQTSPDAVTKREDWLRSILNVGLCDVKADVVVPAIKKAPVDIVSSSFCLEVCQESLEEYVYLIKKLYDLTVPKGFFISQTTLEVSWYKVGQIKHPNPCPVSLEDVKWAYRKAGYNILYSDFWDRPMELRNVGSDSVGFSFIVAQKP